MDINIKHQKNQGKSTTSATEAFRSYISTFSDRFQFATESKRKLIIANRKGVLPKKVITRYIKILEQRTEK